MSKINTLLRILMLPVIAYLLYCIAIYSSQKDLIFPSKAVKPVAANWQPRGEGAEQALIKSSCGQLHVALWRTPDAKGTLMMFHGNGESLASVDEAVAAFLALGYNLMAWDYPGYGQSTDCWFNQDMLLADAESAYQWLATKESPEKIYIFGYSIGTGIALSVASNHQKNPVFLVAAYDALKNIAADKTIATLFPVNLLFRYPMQTQHWVEKIQQPIYLIHGQQDHIILPKYAQALINHAKGKALIEWVNNAGHADDVLFSYRNNWLKRLLP